MEVDGPEAAAVPLLGGNAIGNGGQPWWTKAWVKWTSLSMLTVAITCVIGWLSVGSLDYAVWINTMASMDGKARRAALFVFGGDLTTLFLIYSPMDTFIDICRVGNVGARTHVANVAAVVNCAVWSWYGAVLPSANYSVLVTNLTGVAFHTGYLIVFFIYCRGRRAFYFTWVAIGVLFAMAIAGTCLYLKSAGIDLPQVVGSFGLITGIAMYLGGTMDNMVIARQTNGEEGRTALLATFCNALLWMVYAMIIGDTSMLIPSVAGILLCAIQIIQRCLYRFYMPAGELEARLRDDVMAVVAWAKAKLAAARGVPAAYGETTGTAESTGRAEARAEGTDASAARAEETNTAAAADNNDGQP